MVDTQGLLKRLTEEANVRLHGPSAESRGWLDRRKTSSICMYISFPALETRCFLCGVRSVDRCGTSTRFVPLATSSKILKDYTVNDLSALAAPSPFEQAQVGLHRTEETIGQSQRRTPPLMRMRRRPSRAVRRSPCGVQPRRVNRQAPFRLCTILSVWENGTSSGRNYWRRMVWTLLRCSMLLMASAAQISKRPRIYDSLHHLNSDTSSTII